MKTKVKRVNLKRVVFLCLVVVLAAFCVPVCGFAPMKSVARAEEAFTVKGEKGTAGTIAAKSEMFSDTAAYKFDNPPANIAGVNYIKSPQAGDTYTVTSGEGYVYVLTVADNPYVAASAKPAGEVSQSQNLLLDGFEQVKFTFYVNFCDAHSNNNNSNHYTFFPFEVYKKFMRNGAKFTLENTSAVMFSQKEICFETAMPKDASNAIAYIAGGGLIWKDGTEKFSDSLPAPFYGLPFMQAAKGTATSASIRNGYVYCLATNASLTGYTQVADLKVKAVEGSETEYNVFYKTINRKQQRAHNGRRRESALEFGHRAAPSSQENANEHHSRRQTEHFVRVS